MARVVAREDMRPFDPRRGPDDVGGGAMGEAMEDLRSMLASPQAAHRPEEREMVGLANPSRKISTTPSAAFSFNTRPRTAASMPFRSSTST